mmetsp:Transcript_104442/g.265101  ORF Transcript_104442/g.265101 Transcript_104442/m.265101 type:complete len:206 (+) Transcript_104442:844-1461(+)
MAAVRRVLEAKPQALMQRRQVRGCSQRLRELHVRNLAPFRGSASQAAQPALHLQQGGRHEHPCVARADPRPEVLPDPGQEGPQLEGGREHLWGGAHLRAAALVLGARVVGDALVDRAALLVGCAGAGRENGRRRADRVGSEATVLVRHHLALAAETTERRRRGRRRGRRRSRGRLGHRDHGGRHRLGHHPRERCNGGPWTLPRRP